MLQCNIGSEFLLSALAGSEFDRRFGGIPHSVTEFERKASGFHLAIRRSLWYNFYVEAATSINPATPALSR